MSSQIKSNSGQHYTTRSMNGIITFDDGAGNIIEGGTITSNGVVVDGDVEADNMLEADENETITGTWSFTSIPYSTITAQLDTQIPNKLYVDTEANTKVSKSGDETINGIKTFVSSPIVPNPTTDLQVANKGSYETFGYSTFASLTDNNTLTGINSFNQQVYLPNSNQTDDLMSASKGYVDNFGYTNFVSLTDDQTIGGIKSFSNQVYLPNSNQTNDLMSASKGYVDNFGYTNFCSLTDNNTLTGINSFNQQVFLPNSNQTDALMASSKGYVDAQIAGIDLTNYMTTNTDQTIDGIKTYNTGKNPLVDTPDYYGAGIYYQVPNCAFITNNFVNNKDAQSIDGVKRFRDGLRYDLAPVVNTDVVNKLALDNAIASVPAPSGVVLTTTNQNVGGIKTFTDTLQLNTTGTSQTIKLWNGNGNEPASTGMGINALNSITTGENNTAMGISTLNILTTGSNNTAFGSYAGTSVQASGTTAVGAFSLTTNTADDNTAIGYEALKVNTTGANNVAVGSQALDTCGTGSNNVAIGRLALSNTYSSSTNTAVGYSSLLNNLSGHTNTALGAYTLNNNTTGQENVAIGSNALYANTTGNYNVAIGRLANDNNTTAQNNIAIGYNAIQKITGDNNISIGKNNYSIYDDTGANRNIVIGSDSGQRLGNSRCIVIGYASAQAMDATENIVIGNYSGKGMETSCSYSTCIGDDSGILTGSGATRVQVFGNEVLADESNFIYMGRGIQMSNVVSGVDSFTTTGAWLSSQLIFQNQGATGSKWVGGTIGAYIKSNNNGTGGYPSGLVFRTKRPTGTAGYSGLTEAMYIDANGRVGIGTSNPKCSLEINNTLSKTYGNVNDPLITYFSYNANGRIGQFNFNASNAYYLSIITDGAIFSETYAGASDERIKENIIEVDDETSLQMIRDIPCRYYDYKDKIGKGFKKTIGFISQDVEKILPMAVSKITRHIPNEYRLLENITWTDGDIDVSGNVIDYKMSCDLTDVSGVDYKFFLTNSTDDEKHTELNIVGNEDDTFTFTEKYSHVFCYGKQVDDFRALDKNKIFALHHSGIQEIDKQQVADKARITQLETQVSDLIVRLQALEAHFNQ